MSIVVTGETVIVLALIVTTMTAAVLSVISWWNRHQPGIRWFALHTGLIAVWLFTALWALVADGQSTTLLLGLFTNGLSISVLLSWFLFIVTYLGYAPSLDRREGELLLAAAGGAYVLVYVTPPATDLVAADPRTVDWNGFVVYEFGLTPVSSAVLVASIALFSVGLALIVRTAVTGDRLRMTQALVLGAAALVPIVVGLATGALPDMPRGNPITQIAFAIPVLLYGLALWRYGLFTLSPATERIGFERALESLDAGVVVAGADGRVIEANSTARSILGRDGSMASESLSAVLAGAGFDEDGAQTIERDGTYYRVVRSPITDGEAEIGRSVLLVDVTEQRLREQRLDVLDRILRHNLRNRLTVVIGNIEAADMHTDDPELAAYLANARHASETLLSTTDKARSFEAALRRRANTTDLQVRSVVVEAVDRAIGDRRDVETAIKVDEYLSVETNSNLFRLVVSNLVENAVVHNDAERPSVTVTGHRDEDGVVLAISDNGPGIPEREIDIIEGGEETALEHGSGLGLWLIAWAVPQLGGSVDFRNGGDGTVVELTVSARSTASERSDAVGSGGDAAAGETESVAESLATDADARRGDE